MTLVHDLTLVPNLNIFFQAFYVIKWICKVYKAMARWTIKSMIWTIIETPRTIINGFGPFITHPTDERFFFFSFFPCE